ncbi:hypothetical protein OG21DRAFT_1514576 [Imleria badia]|nr:hypothetical protein OG21DRAFT_1514576 [Imleria badia]
MDRASSMDGVPNLLGLPNHFPKTPSRLPSMSTHRVDKDESRRSLQGLVSRGRHTESYGRVGAESGKSDTLYTLYMEWRACRSSPEAR